MIHKNSVCLTVLCENSIGRPLAAVGEHGFSCLIETASGAYLFDTGQGFGLLRNARALRKDLSAVKKVIISHGHYDHTGGLPDLLSATGEIEVISHPDIFIDRYWAGQGPTRYIGIPFKRPYLESLGARFRFESGFCEVAPGLWLTGEVPRRNPVEKPEKNMVRVMDDGSRVQDSLTDDLSIVIESAKGPILLLGCAHAGLINIMHHVRECKGWENFYAVIGGTHLVGADDDRVAATIEALEEFSVQRIGTAHCTSLPRAAQLQAHFGSRFLFASVGAVLEA
jgi:7,8-dihydropterin-6-yl-methyl-4-(beta-D-ribofuranosyl)aminobenzene 5'-phosphate synthase